jgi:hypothetical protein
MEEKNVIEICVGVGMNQIFPETIKIIIEDTKKLKPIKENEEERDHDKYIYY